MLCPSLAKNPGRKLAAAAVEFLSLFPLQRRPPSMSVGGERRRQKRRRQPRIQRCGRGKGRRRRSHERKRGSGGQTEKSEEERTRIKDGDGHDAVTGEKKEYMKAITYWTYRTNMKTEDATMHGRETRGDAGKGEETVKDEPPPRRGEKDRGWGKGKGAYGRL